MLDAFFYYFLPASALRSHRAAPVDGHVTIKISLLAETAAAHRNEMENYVVDAAYSDLDENNYSECRNFDQLFIDGRSAVVSSVINFFPDVNDYIWAGLREKV